MLGTVELLEQILIHIGQTKPFRSVEDQQRTSAELRALLVSQRVNTIWRDLVKRNTDIQRTLCLAPPLADSVPESLHMRWNNIIWLPEKGVEGIDILDEIFDHKGVPSSRRKMLVAPLGKRLFLTVTIHRKPHRHAYGVVYNQAVTMEELLQDLKISYAIFDKKQVKQARLTIRQGKSQCRNMGELILDAYFDSGPVMARCDEHWTESQCKICAWVRT